VTALQICRSNDLWRLLYLGSASPRSPDEALEALASDIGWRRLYFTNKLQLQVMNHDARLRPSIIVLVLSNKYELPTLYTIHSSSFWSS